jgi:hypothetical protein
MANTKVSQLPEYSGNPTGGYSVFNNSGETTTYKIKNYNLFGDLNTIGSGSKYPFVVGSGNTLDNQLQVAIGYGNTMTGGSLRDSGLNANMIVGNNNSITDSYSSNIMMVGQRNTNGGWNSMVVGQDNIVNYNLDGIVVGQSNNVAVEYGFVFGQNNNSTSQGSFITGRDNTAQGYAISYEAPFIHGFNNSTVMSHSIGILGGRFNAITGVMYDSDARPYYDCIIGGEYNTIGTYITGSTIVGSSYSTISGTSATTINSNILGGSNNIIGSLSNVQMIGCSGRTADASNTTYVENLRVFRQAQYGNFNNGNRSINYTIDWDNGNIQKVVLTGSCVFSATNITDGTTYIFKVSQDGTGNKLATWSSGIFKFANSTPPTLSTGANAVDIFTFVAMDGLLYGVAQLNFG